MATIYVEVWAKIVPNSDLNADGKWIAITVPKDIIEPRADWDELSAHAPIGYHVVQIKRKWR